MRAFRAVAFVCGVIFCGCEAKEPAVNTPRNAAGAGPEIASEGTCGPADATSGAPREGISPAEDTTATQSAGHQQRSAVTASEAHPPLVEPIAAEGLCRKLQQDYWSFDGMEKKELVRKPIEDLSWPQTLRLLHLACLEMLGDNDQLKGLPRGPAQAKTRSSRNLCMALLQRLIDEDSPYGPVAAVVFRGTTDASKLPCFVSQGRAMNSSLTHLGALEVIRVDKSGKPKELAFVGLSELREVVFLNSGVFRAAHLTYADGRAKEAVLVPTVYGVSWHMADERDGARDGTRFYCHVKAQSLRENLGVAAGKQSIKTVNTSGVCASGNLTGVSRIILGFSTSAPEFEEWCRANEIDPAELRGRLFPQCMAG